MTVQVLMGHLNPYNHHLPRTGRMASVFADVLGMKPEERAIFVYGARLHDVGKLRVDTTLLNAPRKLSDNDLAVVRLHARLGADLGRELDWAPMIVDVVEHHHERWDGTGYPDGLQGNEISLEARAMALIDVWDALRHDRPYRKALSVEEARGVLYQQRGWYDPELLTLFLNEVAIHE